MNSSNLTNLINPKTENLNVFVFFLQKILAHFPKPYILPTDIQSLLKLKELTEIDKPNPSWTTVNTRGFPAPFYIYKVFLDTDQLINFNP